MVNIMIMKLKFCRAKTQNYDRLCGVEVEGSPVAQEFAG